MPVDEQDEQKDTVVNKQLAYDERGERSMTKTEVRSFTAKSEDIARHDIFYINPRIIEADESTNPRTKYGEGAVWQEFVDSIRTNGVEEAIRVFARQDKDGNTRFVLAQGFRRHRAIRQIIAEDPDALIRVPAIIVEGNKEKMLIAHATLNMGKPLEEDEKAGIIAQLSAYGYKIPRIAQVMSYSEHRVRQLLAYQNGASEQVKEAVKNNIVTLAIAQSLVATTPDTEKQNEILATAIQTRTEKEAAKPRPAPKPSAKNEPVTSVAVIADKLTDVHDSVDNADDDDEADAKALKEAAANPAPVVPVRLARSDFDAAAVNVAPKRVNFETRFDSLIERLVTDADQFPEDIDILFYDRFREVYKQLKSGKTNIEIIRTSFYV